MGAHGAHCQVSSSCGVTVGASSWPPCWGMPGFSGKPTAGQNTGAILGGTQASEDGSLGSRAHPVPSCPQGTLLPGHTGTPQDHRCWARGGTWLAARPPSCWIDSAGPSLLRPVWRGEVCPSLPGLVLQCCGVLSFLLPLCWAHPHLPLADVNECATGNAGCEGECHNTVGGFYCRCPPGRQLQGDGKTCRGRSPAQPRAPARVWPKHPCPDCSWAASSPPLGCSAEGPGVAPSSLGSSLPDCSPHLWGIHVSPKTSLGGSESLMWVDGTLGAVLGREIALLAGRERQVVGRRCSWGGWAGSSQARV